MVVKTANRWERIPKALLLWAGILLILPSAVLAQEVVFESSVSARRVEIGERFNLSLTVNQRGKDFQPPELGEFLVLSGPNTSSSTSIQMVNGKMTQRITISYNYVLQALREGKFTIGPATITVGKDEYITQPIEITVVKGADRPATAPGAEQPQNTAIPDIKGDDLFVRVHLSENEVYMGEPLFATIKIYSRVDLTGIENVRFPNFAGFLQQEIETPPLQSLEREVINGMVYGTGVIRRLLLIPQKSGRQNLEPAEIECAVRQRVRSNRRSLFDDFFDYSYNNVKRTIKSPALEVNVKPLPPGKPDQFHGLVGNFTLDAGVDNMEVSENEAVNLRIKVAGSGNLRLMETPEINFPPDFEVYEPKVDEKINNTVAGASGTKTFEYLTIPRSAGTFRIPPTEIAFFNPDKGTYEFLNIPEFVITVTRTDEEISGPVSGFGKEVLVTVGNDIRFIKLNNIKFVLAGKRFFGSFVYYLIPGLALLIFIVIYLVRRSRIKFAQNHELVKNRRASKLARRRLKAASRAIKAEDQDLFYEELLKGIWGYLSDKLNISSSELSKEQVSIALKDHKIDDITEHELFEMIGRCEYARYAPSGEKESMEQTMQSVMKLLSDLENRLR